MTIACRECPREFVQVAEFRSPLMPGREYIFACACGRSALFVAFYVGKELTRRWIDRPAWRGERKDAVEATIRRLRETDWQRPVRSMARISQ